MNVRDLRDLANRQIDAGNGDAEVLFAAEPFESELFHVEHFSTDSVNGTVTLARPTP